MLTTGSSIWPKEAAVSPGELRDSAEQTIRAVLADMEQGQTAGEQSEKSKGRDGRGKESDGLDNASVVHGVARVGSGLKISELVSEYRALRASVLRLWQAGRPHPDAHDLDDVTRFNEAIDQSLTRAIGSFNDRLEKSRKMFLAILGHDLRNPLAAITLSANLAQMTKAAEDRSALLSQIVSSAEAISTLVTDLIQFTSSTMGVQLPLSRAEMAIDSLCQDVIRETAAANPGRKIDLKVNGHASGKWDAHRLRQLLGNLLGNAIQHGSATEPITVTVDGSNDDTAVIKVHNSGPPIPAEMLPTIFDPLVRGHTSVENRRKPGSIGLGLYIAREIATAHGGTIAMTSSAHDGTIAVVRLPR